MRLTILLLILVVAVAFVGNAMAVLPGKTVEYPDGDQGKVVFNGDTHGPKQGMSCPKCHPNPFGPPAPHKEKMKITIADHVPGKLCGVCHDGTKSFSQSTEADCVKCHKKAAVEAEPKKEAAPAAEEEKK
ncbi:MAG: cytochrome c3 family protein [Nitrospirota bacterium]|nr:cytochrome c3 family protein [Nitrospirota bacterium]